MYWTTTRSPTYMNWASILLENHSGFCKILATIIPISSIQRAETMNPNEMYLKNWMTVHTNGGALLLPYREYLIQVHEFVAFFKHVTLYVQAKEMSFHFSLLILDIDHLISDSEYCLLLSVEGGNQIFYWFCRVMVIGKMYKPCSLSQRCCTDITVDHTIFFDTK
mmetsp:Transcript_81226/g.218447  ORF Transcript_81226/g.218447 Transcript_81226/m.218447 type:complete len:165 (+) Transcript_81226:407-901(+)